MSEMLEANFESLDTIPLEANFIVKPVINVDEVEIDAEVTKNSNNLITSGAVYNAIENVTINSKNYKGLIESIEELPALEESYLGFFYKIVNDFITTNDFYEGPNLEYTAGSYIIIIKDSLENFKYSLLSTFINVNKFVTSDSNTIFFNKTIDANNNIIENLSLNNLEDNIVRLDVRSSNNASNEALATEKAIALAIENQATDTIENLKDYSDAQDAILSERITILENYTIIDGGSSANF